MFWRADCQTTVLKCATPAAMSLLRRAACPQRVVPKRVCEAVKNPLIGGPNQKARGAITSGFAGGGAKRLGGKGYGIMADWCDHGYSFTKGQAITGMPHWPLWCGGGVPDKFIKIDPDVHFNLQGYRERIGWYGFFTAFLQANYHAFVYFVRFIPINIAIFWIYVNERQREPQENVMDHEEFFRDFDSIYLGQVFDHHRFAEWLARRRALKWGYADQIHIPPVH